MEIHIIFWAVPTATAAATPTAAAKPAAEKAPETLDLPYAMSHGLKNEGAKITAQLLETTDAMEVVNDILIPALDSAGKLFEQGKIFLPQLIQTASVAQAAPSPACLVDLATVFSVSTDYLLGIEHSAIVDVSGLNDKDVAVLAELADRLRNRNH